MATYNFPKVPRIDFIRNIGKKLRKRKMAKKKDTIKKAGDVIFKKPIVATASAFATLDMKLSGDKRKIKKILKENKKIQEDLFN